jgi:hypothetical protein
MTVNLSLFAGAGWQFFDNNGTPLSGGLVYTYAAGTTTPATTYTTLAGNVANANPIILDSAGRVPNEIWLTNLLSYKFVLKDATLVTIGTYDNIFGANDSSAIDAFKVDLANSSNPALGDALVGFRQSNAAGNLTGSVGSTVHSKLQEIVSVKDFGAKGDGTTDDYAAITTAIANSQSIYFPNGTYNHSQTINWTKFGIQVNSESEAGVVFQHTGTGVAQKLDGGNIVTAAASYNARIGPFRINGNANTTNGFEVTNCHNWEINITVNNVSGVGFLSRFAIDGILNFKSTPNGGYGSSPQLSRGIQLDGNSRSFNGQINNGVAGGGTPGTVLTVLSIAADAAPLAIGMVVTGVGVIAGTKITAFGTGTGGVGTYTVSISQDVGGAGELMYDNGVTGPTNGVLVIAPIVVGCSDVGIYLGNAGGNVLEKPEVETNGTYNIYCKPNVAILNQINSPYSNGDMVDYGSNNLWTNMVNGGTFYLGASGAGAYMPRVIGGQTTNLNIQASTVNAYIRGLVYATTITDSSTTSDLDIGKTDATFPVGHTFQTIYIACAEVIGQLRNYAQELTASGAFSNNISQLQLNHATVPIVATWPTAPVQGRLAYIINTSATGTAAHSVKLPAGVTFDGTNNTVTLNAPDEAVSLNGSSTTRWRVLSFVGSPTYSIT